MWLPCLTPSSDEIPTHCAGQCNGSVPRTHLCFLSSVTHLSVHSVPDANEVDEADRVQDPARKGCDTLRTLDEAPHCGGICKRSQRLQGNDTRCLC